MTKSLCSPFRLSHSLPRLPIAVCLLFLAAIPAHAQQTDTQKKAHAQSQAYLQRFQQAQNAQIEQMKRGVVLIKAKGNGNDEGTGFVIASTPASVTIATALHVVANVAEITVFFYTDPTPHTAVRLPRHSDNLDLALIQVKATPAAPLIANIPTYNFAANDTLHVTQQVLSVNGHWVFATNTINSLNDDGDPQKFDYSNNSVGAGFSGAPVFDSYGDIIGMHISHSGDATVATADKIDSALQVLDALGYAVPKAGPVVMPNPLGTTTATTPGSPGSSPAAPAGKCDKGCQTTLGALKHVQHYTLQLSAARAALLGSRAAASASAEDVFALPANWPGSRFFLHVITSPGTTPGTPIVRIYFAETDHERDSDMMIGLANLTGSTGQGRFRDDSNTSYSLNLRNPNFGATFSLNAISIELQPKFVNPMQ